MTYTCLNIYDPSIHTYSHNQCNPNFLHLEPLFLDCFTRAPIGFYTGMQIFTHVWLINRACEQQCNFWAKFPESYALSLTELYWKFKMLPCGILFNKRCYWHTYLSIVSLHAEPDSSSCSPVWLIFSLLSDSASVTNTALHSHWFITLMSWETK